jgi:hypothetical protein
MNIARKLPPTSSGEHPAVREFHRKAHEIVKRCDERRSSKPPRDPRREDDEPVPVDVVELEEDDDVS